MRNADTKRDPLPPESASLEELAEFWGSHDTTDYADAFVTVDAELDIRRRHYEVEVREDVFAAAQRRSDQRRVSIAEVIDEVLRERLLPAG